MKRLTTSLVSAIGLAVLSLAPPAHAEDVPSVDGPPGCTTYVDDGGMVVDCSDGSDGSDGGSEGFEGDPGIYVDPAPEDSGEGYAEGDEGTVVEADEEYVEDAPVDEYVEEAPVEEAPVDEYVEEIPAEEYPPSDDTVCYQVIPVESCDTCEVYATDGQEETTGSPVAAESGPVLAPVEPTSATVDDVTPTGAAPAPAPEAPAGETVAEAAPAADVPAADEPVTAAAPAVPRAALADAVTAVEVEVEPVSEEVPAIQPSTQDDPLGRTPWLVTIALVLAGAAAVGGWLRLRIR